MKIGKSKKIDLGTYNVRASSVYIQKTIYKILCDSVTN